ncbi:MAG: TIGR03986 family CRISPR-associated RAMP protein [Clostridium cochlearium]|uniref:TIGR03986 family type III CRISPR-associated RAMP protein n=1 Tax=Clostridium cochlearium TaxID=1494 RepID=UPI00280A920C|nr:TIGR03986 family CRISPR-associated RAMP protein [Clostridium cochlearium]MDU1443559.1 TIGR03986 family CRISPR-associated RAMP protein [Clostridium cochlearium]
MSYKEYATAPYNFISIPNQVIIRYGESNSNKRFSLPRHDILDKDFLNGYIDYEILAESPIIVSKGTEKQGNINKSQFFKNLNNEYAIPGSTIRGMIRFNSAILSRSSLVDEIEDNLFLYRNLAGKDKSVKNQYGNILGIKPEKTKKGSTYSILKNVKAGYIIRKSKDEYVIKPAKVINDRSYFRMEGNDLKREIDEERFNYIKEVYFSISGKKNIKEVSQNKELKYKGYLISSGKMHNKKARYIIPEIDKEKEEQKIPVEYIHAYEEDLIRTKKKTKENDKGTEENSYYYLPQKNGDMKPIFYIRYNGKLYFGFTPYLRIYYEYSVKKGINEEYKNPKELDYCKAIFGYTDGEKSLKSRVNFRDAILVKGKVKEKNDTVVLGEPKATCYQHYLKQPNGNDLSKMVSYNDEDFQIRGLKQYWIKDDIYPQKSDKPNVNINIKSIDKGALFRGRIYFENLNEDELGLILWALKLKENCYQNIGQAKPYGYGKVKIKNVELKVEDLKNKYGDFTLDFMENENVEEYIDKYKKFIKNEYGQDVEEFKEVEEFFTMKSKELKKEESKYLELGEFKHRKVLQEVKEIKDYKEKGQYKNNNVSYSNKKGNYGNKKIINKESLSTKINDGIKRICIQCGKEFIINKAQQKALDERGYKYPKKCYDCRNK